MKKNRYFRRVFEYYPHLGHNVLTFYIFIRLFQWTTIFFSDPPREVFFNIDPEIYPGILHMTSLIIGLFLIFKVRWSPLLAQLYQLFLVAHPIFLSSGISELITELLSNLVSERLITRRPDYGWLPQGHHEIALPQSPVLTAEIL